MGRPRGAGSAGIGRGDRRVGGWQREGRTRREERETGRARKRESEKGNPGEEERAVVEGHGEKEKEIVRERERRGETAREREREREKRGWRLKDENSVSPRERTGQKQERRRESGVGVLQRREGVRERLGETRDSSARDAETEGETGERETG